ncbi:hypothetical protein Tco_0923327 [Tanacetum coccineum]|uniref:Uncharacterized protein n=1 Tax=Tanacetum coccineum TaxID=301880 RepID=A0ABQ5D413_9ASTR
MGTVTFIEPELDSYYLKCVKCAKNKVRKSQDAYLGDIDVIDEDGVSLIYRKCKTIQIEFVQRVQHYNWVECVYDSRLCDDDNIIQQMIKDDATKVVETDVDVETLKNDESDGSCLDTKFIHLTITLFKYNDMCSIPKEVDNFVFVNFLKDVISGNRDWFPPSDATLWLNAKETCLLLIVQQITNS